MATHRVAFCFAVLLLQDASCSIRTGKRAGVRGPSIQAHVSEEVHEAWRRFARDEGVTASALIEVLGRRLDEASESGRKPKWLADLVRDARAEGEQRMRR